MKSDRLNLGSADNLVDGYLNVDRFNFARAGKEFLQADLNKTWPWDTSSVDLIRANDIFEHLCPTVELQNFYPKPGDANVGMAEVRRADVQPKTWVMNEAHRILKPGGILDMIVPTTDGRGAYQDPTHVTFWTPNDLFYFCEHWEEWKRFRAAYGITAQFRIFGAAPGFDGRSEAWGFINSPGSSPHFDGHRQVANSVWKLHVRMEAIK